MRLMNSLRSDADNEGGSLPLPANLTFPFGARTRQSAQH
jgi:hypothetical protein